MVTINPAYPQEVRTSILWLIIIVLVVLALAGGGWDGSGRTYFIDF